MDGPFVYLTVRSIWNQGRARLARLRQPRYLIGALVGAVYFYSIFFRRPRGARGAPGSLLAILAPIHEQIVLVGALLLVAVTAIAWMLPGSRPALTFTAGEVQFLLTAPVSRRAILRYKVLRSQLPLLFSTALTTVVLRPGSLGRAWTFFVGMFLMSTVLRLHLTGAKLQRRSLAQRGRTGWRSWPPPLLLVAGAIAVLATTVVRHWDGIMTAAARGQLMDELLRLSSAGAPAIVLWPFRALARMPLSASPAEFLQLLPFILALIAAAYIWIIRSDARFEEGAAASADKTAASTAAGRPIAPVTRPRRTPFALGPAGRIEMAIVWKNLIRLSRYASPAVFVRVVGVLVIGLTFALRTQGAVVASVALFATGFTILMGPLTMNNDLRQDLRHLASLKTWPIHGAVLVRAEIAAPALVLTAFAWTAIVVAGVALSGPRLAMLPPIVAAHRLDATLAALALAPGLIAVQLTIQNAVALVFPAWLALNSTKSRGLDVMGQRMFFLAGTTVVLLAALVPAVIAGAAVAGALHAATGVVSLVVPALVALVVLLGECAVTSEILGRVFDRTDPSAVEAAE